VDAIGGMIVAIHRYVAFVDGQVAALTTLHNFVCRPDGRRHTATEEVRHEAIGLRLPRLGSGEVDKAQVAVECKTIVEDVKEKLGLRRTGVGWLSPSVRRKRYAGQADRGRDAAEDDDADEYADEDIADGIGDYMAAMYVEDDGDEEFVEP